MADKKYDMCTNWCYTKLQVYQAIDKSNSDIIAAILGTIL